MIDLSQIDDLARRLSALVPPGLREGKLDAALVAFRKAAESNSNYPNAYYGAGLVFLRQNRFSDAEQVLQYAKALYTAQGNSQWAANADQLLQKARNSTP